jgi:hypothetical protein
MGRQINGSNGGELRPRQGNDGKLYQVLLRM